MQINTFRIHQMKKSSKLKIDDQTHSHHDMIFNDKFEKTLTKADRATISDKTVLSILRLFAK